ncbi:hypothetical protein B1A59_02830 [Corynebacterium diphtheriae]|nr:hypothetical protein B1A59_02830 [Corynebacterium diphtheriae]
MTTGKDTHDCDYFTSLFLLPQLCNSTFQGHMGAVERSGGSADGGGCRSRRGVFLFRLGRSQVSRIQINAA